MGNPFVTGTLALMLAALAPLPARLAAQQPLLHVVATDARWLAAFTQALALTPPPLAAGERYELRVADDGTPTLRTIAAPSTAGTPTPPLLTVELRAGAWLARLGEPLVRTERDWTNRAIGFAQLAGLPPRATGGLVADLFTLARDVELVRATVAAAAGERAADVHVELQPRAGSPFAGWLANVRPATTPAPRWPWDDALAQLRIGIAADRLADVLAPFLPLAVALGEQSPEQLLQRAGWLDGRAALALREHQLGLAVGLRDAAAFVAHANDAARWQREAEALAAHGVTTTTTSCAPYHDISLLQTTTESRAPLPWLADDDGVLVAFGGRVGPLWLQLGGHDARPAIECAIDDALAGRLQPNPTTTNTPSTAWLQLELDLGRVRRLFDGSAEPARGGVHRIDLALSTTTAAAPSLCVDLRLR